MGRLTILFLFVATVTHGQTDFELKEIRFKGLAFSTTKATILKSLGPGKRVYTNYDCGFFTTDQPEGPYYQLVYERFNFIGSDKGKFLLQEINFDGDGKMKVSYADKELSGRTTKSDFIQIFGDKAKEHFDKYPTQDTLILYSKDSDDGAKFTFKNGRLAKFEYWTPC
jgi:hypothetical protein